MLLAIHQEHCVYLSFGSFFSAYTYSGERTNSQVGDPTMSRMTIAFFAHTYNTISEDKIQ